MERERERGREHAREDERCGPRMTFQPRTERRRPENREGKNKSTGRANDVSTVRPTGAITNGILQSLRLYLPRRQAAPLCARVSVARFQKNDRVSMRRGDRQPPRVADRKSFAERRQSNRFHVKLDFHPSPRCFSATLLRHARLHPPSGWSTERRHNHRPSTDYPLPRRSILFAFRRLHLFRDFDTRAPPLRATR